MAHGSQQLYYCLFHYPHLHQPYPSCPPLSLCSGLSPLPFQQVHISVYNGQEKQHWLEWHKTNHRFEHCPERSINLLSTTCSTESRYSYLTDQVHSSHLILYSSYINLHTIRSLFLFFLSCPSIPPTRSPSGFCLTPAASLHWPCWSRSPMFRAASCSHIC